jgi:hypothetical protein
MTDNEGERIRALEVRLDHLVLSVDLLTTQVKVLNDLLQAAKGVRWVVAGLLVVAGFIIGKMGLLVGGFK